MQAKDVDAARPYLLMDHFRMEVMARRSRSAGQLVEFVTTFVRFYELVTSVEPKRKALALSTDELKAATQVGHTRPPSCRKHSHVPQLRIFKIFSIPDNSRP